MFTEMVMIICDCAFWLYLKRRNFFIFIFFAFQRNSSLKTPVSLVGTVQNSPSWFPSFHCRPCIQSPFHTAARQVFRKHKFTALVKTPRMDCFFRSSYKNRNRDLVQSFRGRSLTLSFSFLPYLTESPVASKQRVSTQNSFMSLYLLLSPNKMIRM